MVGTPIGILAGTYMAEYGRFSKLTTVVRFINDILLSRAVDHHRPVRLRADGACRWGISRRSPAPSRWPMIVIPVVVRTTEDMLLPRAERAARSRRRARRAALDGHHARVAYRAARAGIVTGVLLAIARITRRDRAAALHRAQQPVLDRAISTRRWPACR